MRLPTIEEWSAVGDPEDGSGFITYRRVPAHWWLLDWWLERGHPHWRWWYRLWGRLMPYWGDPFCAAYTVVWAPFYGSRSGDGTRIDVGWDALPAPARANLIATLASEE